MFQICHFSLVKIDDLMIIVYNVLYFNTINNHQSIINQSSNHQSKTNLTCNHQIIKSKMK